MPDDEIVEEPLTSDELDETADHAVEAEDEDEDEEKKGKRAKPRKVQW